MEFEPPVVVYDASVLFAFQTAHILTFVAQAKLVQAHWSSDIEREWVERSLEHYPKLDRKSVERRRDAMNRGVPTASVTGYESRIEGISFPDPNDRHVVAVAIECNATIVVTRDKKHFNERSLSPFRLRSIDPDALLCDLFEAVPELVLEVVDMARAALAKTKPDVHAYMELLSKTGLNHFAASIEKHITDRYTIKPPGG